MNKKIPLGSILFIFSVTYFLFFSDFMKADGCLDSGGCWDYKDNICRKEEPDAQKLCDRANPYR
jgi:hypothetical protein